MKLIITFGFVLLSPSLQLQAQRWTFQTFTNSPKMSHFGFPFTLMDEK
ncbi:MAG: hypothetical protein AAFW00_12920 [Bacteroidota bacterium]